MISSVRNLPGNLINNCCTTFFKKSWKKFRNRILRPWVSCQSWIKILKVSSYDLLIWFLSHVHIGLWEKNYDTLRYLAYFDLKQNTILWRHFTILSLKYTILYDTRQSPFFGQLNSIASIVKYRNSTMIFIELSNGSRVFSLKNKYENPLSSFPPWLSNLKLHPDKWKRKTTSLKFKLV